MRILCRTFLVAALAWAGTALSADCEGLRCYGSISTLDVEAPGAIYVGLSGGLAGLTGCTPMSGSDQYFTLLQTSPNAGQIYSLLLAAAMNGMPIAITAESGSSGCTIHYVTVTHP